MADSLNSPEQASQEIPTFWLPAELYDNYDSSRAIMDAVREQLRTLGYDPSRLL